jgi:hypothetical protein
LGGNIERRKRRNEEIIEREIEENIYAEIKKNKEATVCVMAGSKRDADGIVCPCFDIPGNCTFQVALLSRAQFCGQS